MIRFLGHTQASLSSFGERFIHLTVFCFSAFVYTTAFGLLTGVALELLTVLTAVGFLKPILFSPLLWLFATRVCLSARYKTRNKKRL
ncbi:uncharacterized protein EV154DRAFT_242701 [Mucor mucedo]|uniref:uncharacterized protein n=1 Tax=Mucor mucedo TaxID=29922 RepID=UPI00221FE769|nr:uncharacterized protein EV154DRAFT_242701 [Mucor mucedo]KAI7890819.1 hypothetical protein EV154DRAFT_242701 [Mucor mucedo]